MNTQFEFKNKRLTQYMDQIRDESQALMNRIIKEHSPVQVGEDVKINCTYSGESQMLRVAKITISAVNSFGCPGDRFFFSYWGKPLTSKGVPMKNRRLVWFYYFSKNGEDYHMPSYSSVEIKTARMY